ncbi:MAG: hypothetical protein ABJN42_10025 [Roseibium sp.]|uniref:hypothetical protein n=1 Tax=Roseibium sp. TaxID=1936156 RepID=UPI0032985DCB
MSTGLECDIVGLSDGRWFYMLESPSCPSGAWDWRAEDPSVGGPFTSEDAAFDGLRKKHANPGGYQSFEISVEEAIADATLKENIECALGTELAFPPLPETPVQVAHVLVETGKFSYGGQSMMTSPQEDGRMLIDFTSSMGANADILHSAQVSCMRDAASIVVEIEREAGQPDETFENITSDIIGRAKRIYPEEMVVLNFRDAEKDIDTPSL